MNQRLDLDYSVDDADRLLDRLESAAMSGTDHDTFWQQALEGLRTLTDCDSASFILPVQGRWAQVHCASSVQQSYAIHEVINQPCNSFPTKADFLPLSNNQSFGVVPLNGATPDQGCILLSFQPPITNSVWSQVRTIAIAIAEICWMQTQKQQEKQLGRPLQRFRVATARFGECTTLHELQRELVDSLVSMLSADRCSLVSTHDHAVLRVCSGVSNIDSRSPTVRAIETVAMDSTNYNKPISLSRDRELRNPTDATDNQPLLDHRLVVPWDSDSAAKPIQVLVLEWLTKRGMVENLQTASELFPLLQVAWNQQRNWLHVPPRSRRRAILQTTSSSAHHMTKRFWKLIFGSVGVSVIACLLLRPAPMRISAEAHLEPAAVRSIHATADGFVDEILVDEEMHVTQGHLLAKLRSPSLDFQIEDTLGKLRTMSEKRNGLSVSINQLANNASDVSTVQTKITSELLILDAQEKHAQETLTFLRKEQERLSIRSPMDGVVVASELRQELLRRPVRRGDSLFRVADLDGQWRLHIQVADRDTQYVAKYYSDRQGQVGFVFDSLPAEQFYAQVNYIAPTAENVLGSGSYQRVFAAVDRKTAQRAHMGATAHVTFHCGEQPAWFVWSRPLVEFVQRRVSFFSTASNAEDSSHDKHR